MFRHQDVILRECVITLLKSLSLLQIVFSYHFVTDTEQLSTTQHTSGTQPYSDLDIPHTQ